MNLTILYFVILTLLNQTKTLYIGLSNTPVCITLVQQSQQQTNFFYQVTGYKPDNFRIEFTQENSSRVSTLIGQKGQTKFVSKRMKICMFSTDLQTKSVSIDYYTSDVAHLAQLASKSHMQQLHKKLVDVGMKVKDVFRGQIFQQEKHSIHGKVIYQQQSKVKLIVFIKVIAILIVAVAQIFLLKVILDNQKKKSYQPLF